VRGLQEGKGGGKQRAEGHQVEREGIKRTTGKKKHENGLQKATAGKKKNYVSGRISSEDQRF